jgi:hypothetical protein
MEPPKEAGRGEFQDLSLAVVALTTELSEAKPSLPVLTLRHLAAPTVLALFVCAISIRYQLLGTTPFQMFWSSILKGKSQLAVVVNGKPGPEPSASLDEIQAAIPLLGLAQAFQVQPSIQNADEAEKGAHDKVVVRMSNQVSSQFESDPRVRLTVRNDEGKLQIVDKLHPEHRWSHAVLISLQSDDGMPTIWIAATDKRALRSGTQLLTDRSTFPQVLLKATANSGVTQAVFDERGDQIFDPARAEN